MNFIVKEKYHFTEIIDIKIPGEKQNQQIIVEFQLLEKDFIEQIKNSDHKQIKIILQNAVVNIRGIIDEKSNEIICDQKLKNRLLSLVFIAKPVLEKYIQVACGIVEKNFEQPSDSKLAENQDITLN